ncbi:MAG: GAF domain-containing protein [Gaiellaceae bacterium]
MTQSAQALWLDAVPLLVVAAAYLGATALLAPPLWAERGRATAVDWALVLLFPSLAVVAAPYGTELAVHRTPLPGGVWPTFAVALALLAPPLLVLARWRERAVVATGGVRVREAVQTSTVRDRELESMAETSSELAAARDAEAVARLLLVQVEGLVGVDVSALVLVADDGRTARGCLLRKDGRELDWFREFQSDLEQEPSGIASAVVEGAPFTVFDAAASTQVSRRLIDAVGAKSTAYFPVIAEGRVIAVLVIGTADERRAFGPEEMNLLQALAGDAALALARARTTSQLADALHRERRRIEQQSALLRAAQSLTSDLQLQPVLERLVEQLAGLLTVDAADCYLLDADRRVLRCAAVYGLPRELVGFEFPADRGLAGRALREGHPVAADEYGALDDPVPGDAYAEFSGALVAPMRLGDAVQGVLGVGARGERRFDEEDAELLEAYAGLASLALANAQAYDARSRQARVERGFFRIASVLGQSLSLEATLEAVAQAANEALGGSFAAVLMPRGSALELAGAADLPAALRDALQHELPASADVLRRAATDARVVASTDVADDDRFDADWLELAKRCGYRALLAVPVASARDGTNGLVLVFFEATRAFADEDLELGRHLADAARGALERSELFEAERTARRLSQQLARTGGVLATELDPTAVLDEVVHQAPELLGADACAIRTVEDDELVVGAASGAGAESAIGTRVPSSARLSGDVFQSRAPVAVDDTTQDDRLLAADPILTAGYRAFLGVPLTGPEGSLHGVLAVYAERPRTWRPEEIEALLALAANTSAALSNAELYSRVSLEKERSVAILANVADGIVAVDRDGQVVLWNAAAGEITGIPAAEALGRTPAQVLQRTLASEGDGPSGPRLVSIARGGEDVWLSLSEAVMRDPLGEVAGRIFAFRDISADRMVEQVKSDFVAAVSHELRTPLTSIYGFAETLLRQDVLFGEEERRIFLGYIASESERLTGIVDQLLNVARLDAGDLHVEPEPIDVASVVSEVVGNVEETGAVNGQRVEVDLPSEPLSAEADRDKLRQVFSILVENALKYSPDGGTVTVGARRTKDVVEVRVIDEGVGIPVAEQERIFRKFYRAESTVRDGAGGTGLGLFIARELVTAMGGRIWVESSEGEGSSFAFELPVARE